MKKIYLEPEFKIVNITLTENILSASQEETLVPDPSIHTEPSEFPSEEW